MRRSALAGRGLGRVEQDDVGEATQVDRNDPDGPLVFAGSASPRLTKEICGHLGVQVGQGEVLRFSEGTLFPRVLENVRGRRVYLVQSTVFPANDHFMELLFWVDAFKRASATSVTVVMPYFSYAKGDKKDEPRVSIRARVCADAIEAAGADRVVTMDLHAAQIQGFFRIPVDDLYARSILCDAIEAEAPPDLVVVSPDAGFAKKARMFASHLGAAGHRRQGARRPRRARHRDRHHRGGRRPQRRAGRRLHRLFATKRGSTSQPCGPVNLSHDAAVQQPRAVLGTLDHEMAEMQALRQRDASVSW
jgi:phosphoribosylpyrophosphate synthetase